MLLCSCEGSPPSQPCGIPPVTFHPLLLRGSHSSLTWSTPPYAVLCLGSNLSRSLSPTPSVCLSWFPLPWAVSACHRAMVLALLAPWTSCLSLVNAYCPLFKFQLRCFSLPGWVKSLLPPPSRPHDFSSWSSSQPTFCIC